MQANKSYILKLQKVLEEQLKSLRAELLIKISSNSDHQLLYERITKLKLQNVSITI